VGRFGEDDYYDDDPAAIMAMGRFIRNARTTVQGKRGQKALRELESMLLAMPVKRLISGWLATPDGEVCTVGLYCAGKRAEKEGVDLRAAVGEMANGGPTNWERYELVSPGVFKVHFGGAERGWDTIIDDDGEGDLPTLDAGESAGLTRTLAYVLGDLNDESCGSCTPEERYEKVLRWVRSKIKADA
jgi:hypothetical protein